MICVSLQAVAENFAHAQIHVRETFILPGSVMTYTFRPLSNLITRNGFQFPRATQNLTDLAFNLSHVTPVLNRHQVPLFPAT